MNNWGRLALGGMPLALLSLCAPLQAQNIGLVTDRGSSVFGGSSPRVFVFDADADILVAEIGLPGAPVALDCEILENQTRGFVAGWSSGVWVIDLTSAPPTVLANVPTPGVSAENLAITGDQQYLLVCDGGGGLAPNPVLVIDIATLTPVDTLDTGEDHKGITASEGGSVLTTGIGGQGYSPHLRRMVLDGQGQLTDTGESVSFQGSNFPAFSTTLEYAVLHNFAAGVGGLRSYRIPGLNLVNSAVPGGKPICGVMNPGADLYYVRTVPDGAGASAVELWQFDNTTGQFVGSAPIQVRPLGRSPAYFGIEQMRLHPDGNKLYVLDDENDKVHILDPSTLIVLGNLSLPASMKNPAGISIRKTSIPLAVDLEYFRARRVAGGRVQINWGTAAELENAGFKVYRQAWSPTPSGLPSAGADLLNPSLIPARGTPFQPTPYRWVDRDALAGQAYQYWLVDIDLHGESTTHGPISVR